MAMARNSGGLSLVWGVVLMISGLWLGVMLSNRSVVLPLFFLGRQTIALPIGFWLFGTFLLGNGISLALLSFLQFTIDRLVQAQAPTRSRFAPSDQSSLEWEDDDLDWQPPQSATTPRNPVTSPVSAPDRSPATAFAPEQQAPLAENEEDAWDDPEWEADPESQKPPATPPLEKPEVSSSPPPSKVYEAPSPPPQGSQAGSSYSYRYRPSRRSQETVKPSTQPSQSRSKAQPGLPQKVVDVNYRIINPGATPSQPPSRPVQPDRDRGWDDSSDPEDW